MRKKGKIQSWNDQRGFGFIESSDGGKDVFLHITALGNRSRRPEIGQYVTYTLSTDKHGRPCAIKATLPGDRVPAKPKQSGALGAVIVAAIFFAIVLAAVAMGKVPPFILGLYLVASVIALIMYAVDKSAAKSGAWRTPESTLHWLSVIGGWPGGLIAQQTLRHKSRKQSFRSVFWITVFVNCSVFVWLLTPDGSGTVKSWSDEGYWIFNSRQTGTIEWTE